MKTVIKAIAIVAAGCVLQMGIASSANAAGYFQDWYVNDHGQANTFSEDKRSMLSFVPASSETHAFIYLYKKEDKCNTFSADRDKRKSIMRVNGQAVKFTSECSAGIEGMRMFSTETLKGDEYIINQLKVSNSVNFNGTITEFSAKGFTSAFDYLNNMDQEAI